MAGVVFLWAFAACSTPRQTVNKDTTGNLIIFYDSATGKEGLLEAVKEYGSEVLYEYKNFNSIAVTVPPKHTVAKAIQFYKKAKGVLAVSEDRKVELATNEVVNTEDVYSNFLASLEEVTARDAKEYKYPDYFGGCFTDDKGICVFQVVSKDSTEDVINDLRRRTKSGCFSIKECEYSYAELEEVLSTIKSKLFDSNFSDTRESLKWHGCYLDSGKNRVIVRLGECTDEYIKRFKATVSDSPMIEFMEGGKNILIHS